MGIVYLVGLRDGSFKFPVHPIEYMQKVCKKISHSGVTGYSGEGYWLSAARAVRASPETCMPFQSDFMTAPSDW
jgi:hypothetical protein